MGERRILEVIRELERATGNGRFFPIVGPVKGELLYALTLVARSAAVLELGTGIGYSCLHMVRALPPGAKMVSVDWDPRNAQEALKNLKRAGMEDVVEVSGPSGKPSQSIHGSGPPSSRSRTASPSA